MCRLLQVGTEAAPFPPAFTAKIVLHGHLNSQELPIYGTKVLALRNGTLDLHGQSGGSEWVSQGVVRGVVRRSIRGLVGVSPVSFI